MEHLLFSRRPADRFEEAYPIGNGRFGGMVYGGVREERISLNDDTLWSGTGRENPAKPGAPEAFAEAGRLVGAGRIAEAEELLAKKFHAMWSQIYLPLGDLTLTFRGGEAVNYRRTLDLADATAGVSFHGGERTYFCSYPDDVMVIRLKNTERTLSFTAALTTGLRALSCRAAGDLLILNGRAPANGCNYSFIQKEPLLYEEGRGMTFTAALKIETDGVLSAKDGALSVEGAGEAVIYLTAKTSFAGYDRDPSDLPLPEARALAVLAPLTREKYPEILARHLSDVRDLLGRAAFSLGGEHRDTIGTEERLRSFDGSDMGLYELLFAFGRYLTVASSRRGSQATTLQGIWNELPAPPWSSNYTININTEMNYWPTLPASLPECYEPYLALAEKLHARGRAAARDFYGAEGFVSHHNTDLWGMANPVGIGRGGEACVYSDFPFSSAWIASQIYDYYEYTLDRGALARIYPVMADAARFYLSMLTEDGDGNLIFTPATSPENHFLAEGGKHSLARQTACGQTLMRELFVRTLRAAGEIGGEEELAEKIRAALARLKKPAVGQDGRLLEWDGERPEAEPEHRHLSHLVGVYPGETVSEKETPQLFAAAKASLERRGEDASGWSLAWKICLASTFRDGEKAKRLLDRQLRFFDPASFCHSMQGGGTFPNFLDAHPPFQIDGNFGAVAGIVNICLQSRGDRIEILPALPSAWKSGSVSGLSAKGNVRVSIAWEDGRAVSVSLLSPRDCDKILATGGREIPVSLKAGEEYRVAL